MTDNLIARLEAAEGPKRMTPYQRWRTCDRKKAYPTLSKANKAIIKSRIKLWAYECPVCACWHVTKKGQK